jgi:hypothetical protein
MGGGIHSADVDVGMRHDFGEAGENREPVFDVGILVGEDVMRIAHFLLRLLVVSAPERVGGFLRDVDLPQRTHVTAGQLARAEHHRSQRLLARWWRALP